MKFDMSAVNDPKDKDILEEEETEAKHDRKAKLTEKIGIVVRQSEKRKLEELAEETGVLKLSPLIRSLLKKHGYI